MDIKNVAVKFLTEKVNSDKELSKADLNKWIKPLPIEFTKYIKDNVNEVSKEELKRVLNDIHNKVTNEILIVQENKVTDALVGGPKKKKIPTKFKKGDVLMHPIFRHPYVLLENKKGMWICGLLTSEPKCPNILEKAESRFFVEEYFTRVMFIESATPPGTYMYPFDNPKQIKSILEKLKHTFI
jgi:hypothetical protein